MSGMLQPCSDTVIQHLCCTTQSCHTPVMQHSHTTPQERERDSTEELEEAKQQAQTATHAFNAVRQARYDTFMKAFNHISAAIDQIFKVSSFAGVRAAFFRSS